MDIIENLRTLESKITDLERKNNSHSNTFYSLQLVLNELQSENDRLKVEKQERTHRLGVMKKVEGQIQGLVELNKNLIKFILEQRASLNRFQTIRQNQQSSLIESNLSFQKNIQEEIKDMKERHCNMKIVKRHAELQRTEFQLAQELEKLDKTFTDEEKHFEIARQSLDQKIFQQIVRLVEQAKCSAHHQTPKVDETPEICRLGRADSTSDSNRTQRNMKQPITICKLGDFQIPDIPKILRRSNQMPNPSEDGEIQNNPKSDKDTRKRSFHSILPQTQSDVINSTTKRCKGSIATIPTEIEHPKGSASTSALVKVPRAEQNQLANIQANNSKLQRLQHCFENSPNVNLVLQQKTETFKLQSVTNSPPESTKSDSKDMRALTIESQSVDLKCNESQAQIEERKKIVVMSNILITGPDGESSSREPTIASKHNVQTIIHASKTQNYTNKGTSAGKTSTKDSLVNMNQSEFREKQATKTNFPTGESCIQTFSSNKLTTQILKTYMKKDRGTSNDGKTVETKSTLLNNPKGVSVQSFQNNTIDLSSQLPPSHITIDSSNKSPENLQVSDKISMLASPAGSINFLNDFLTDFSVGLSPSKTGATKRKGSDDAASFEDGLDFGSFDFSKKSKMGSAEVSDDFFQNFCVAPNNRAEGGDKDVAMFNFDEMMPFK